jgi:hypothetical protein
VENLRRVGWLLFRVETEQVRARARDHPALAARRPRYVRADAGGSEVAGDSEPHIHIRAAIQLAAALVFAYEGHQSGEVFWHGPGRLPRLGRAWIAGCCSGWRLIGRGGERVSHNDCRVALENTSGRRAYAVSPIPLVTSRIAGSRTCCPLSTLPGKPILITHHAL